MQKQKATQPRYSTSFSGASMWSRVTNTLEKHYCGWMNLPTSEALASAKQVIDKLDELNKKLEEPTKSPGAR